MNTKKLCLLTGASRGIGEAILSALAELPEPPIVIALARQEKSRDLMQAKLESLGLEGRAVAVNLADQEAINTLFDSIKEHYDTTPDILINNAGVTDDTLLMRMQEQQWQTVMDTNLNAVFRLCKQVLRGMLKKRYGRIINMSSVVASIGNAGQCNYAASKAAVEAFTKSLAQEVASRGITANTIAPGFIQTDMSSKLSDEQQAAIVANVPMKRMGKTKEVAHAVKFLLDADAGYITGSCIHVNGGLVML